MKLSAARRVLYVSLFSFVLFFGLYYFVSPQFKEPEIPNTQVATVLKLAKPIAPFTLESTLDQPYTEKNLRGHWTLMFFGYSDCPDVCPMAVGTLKQVWEKFPTEEYPAHFVFTSVNPIKDSPSKLKEFLGHYHKDFIGITGTNDQIEKLKNALGIFSSPDIHAVTGQEIIDHSAQLMLINPKGHLKAVFSPPFNADVIAADLALILKG